MNSLLMSDIFSENTADEIYEKSLFFKYLTLGLILKFHDCFWISNECEVDNDSDLFLDARTTVRDSVLILV